MEKILTEVIQKIQARKLDEKKVPQYALETEIWSEIYQRIIIELALMVEDGKLEKRDSINHNMYKIIDKG